MRTQAAIPIYGNFAVILCQKPVQKEGTPWPKATESAPRGGKCAQKCPEDAPKSAFQTSAEAGKVMKYSIFPRLRRVSAYAPPPNNIGAYLITVPASAVVWMAPGNCWML